MLKQVDRDIADHVKEGDLARVKECIRAGANPRINESWLLNICAALGHDDCFDYLVIMGCNVRNGYDCPLRWSAASGHLNIVKRCVEAGADISTYNNEAIVEAERSGHNDVADYLKERLRRRGL